MNYRKAILEQIKELKQNSLWIPRRGEIVEQVKAPNGQDLEEFFIHDGEILDMLQLKLLEDTGQFIRVSSGELYDSQGVFFTAMQNRKQTDKEYYYMLIEYANTALPLNQQRNLSYLIYKETGVQIPPYLMPKVMTILQGEK